MPAEIARTLNPAIEIVVRSHNEQEASLLGKGAERKRRALYPCLRPGSVGGRGFLGCFGFFFSRLLRC